MNARYKIIFILEIYSKSWSNFKSKAVMHSSGSGLEYTETHQRKYSRCWAASTSRTRHNTAMMYPLFVQLKTKRAMMITKNHWQLHKHNSILQWWRQCNDVTIVTLQRGRQCNDVTMVIANTMTSCICGVLELVLFSGHVRIYLIQVERNYFDHCCVMILFLRVPLNAV